MRYIALIVLLAALAGCGSTTQSRTPVVNGTTSAAPVKLTAAQQKFIADMADEYNAASGTASENAALVALGNSICSQFQSGASESSAAGTVTQANGQTSASTAAGIVSLAGRDLCPQAAQVKAQVKAAAAAAARAARIAARRAAAARAAQLAEENTPISSAEWGRVTRNPSAYVGRIFTITGTVSQYDINSNTLATQAGNAALVATDADGNSFIVEGSASMLGNIQVGQTFTAKVTVLGAEEAQNTTYGGDTEVPDFDASTFTVTG